MYIDRYIRHDNTSVYFISMRCMVLYSTYLYWYSAYKDGESI